MLFFSVIFFIFSLMTSIILILKQKKKNTCISFIMPIMFLLIIALYVLPLPIHCLVTERSWWISGNISNNIYNFAPDIPYAVFLSSFFNFIFVLFFSIGIKIKYNKPKYEFLRKPNKLFFYFFILFFIVCVLMLNELSSSVGGIDNMILLGYKITELFIGQQHYAIAFEWIYSLIILYFVYAINSKNKKKLIISIISIIMMGLVYLILGRRGALVVLGISVLFIYDYLVKSISTTKLVIIILIGFFSLNVLGLIRGDSYNNVDNAIDIISEKSKNYSEQNVFQNNMFYTLTTGNFAIPFESFPQIINSFGDDYPPGFGIYTIQSLSLIIPNSVWENRPLPLSNWYMETFYGETKLNEGRQFFILTSSYMDFGAFGILFIAVFFGMVISYLSKNMHYYKNDVIKFTLLALLIGNILNVVSNDLSGFIVAFSKSYVFPVLFLALFTKRIRINNEENN